MNKLYGEIAFVEGYLKAGYYYLELTDSELEEFKELTEEEQIKFIEDNGDIEIEDFEIEALGEVVDIEIKEGVKNE